MRLKKIFQFILMLLFVVGFGLVAVSCQLGNNNQPSDDPSGDPSGDPSSDPSGEPSGDEDPTPDQIAQAALDALLDVSGEKETTFTLKVQGNGGVAISWASSNTDVISINGATATVNRPAPGQADVEVTLTATATLDGVSKSKSFTVTVKAVVDESKTVAELLAQTETATDVYAKGVVTGFIFKTAKENGVMSEIKQGFYLTDATGTIYVYGPSDAAKVEYGQEVYVKGSYSPKGNYNAQLSSLVSITKLADSKAADFSGATAKTLTEVLALGDDAIGNAYKFRGKVLRTSTSTYMNYKVADAADSTKSINVYAGNTSAASYVDTSFTFDDLFQDYAESTFANAKEVDIVFFVQGKSSSGALRGNIIGISDVQYSDEEKVAKTKAEIEDLFKKQFVASEEITLLNPYEITVQASVAESVTTLSVEGLKVTVTPGAGLKEEVLTVVLTSGEATETLQINVKSGDVVADFIDLAETYKASLVQKALNDQELWLKEFATSGDNAGRGLTTLKPSEALQIKFEKAPAGGYYIYTLNSEGQKDKYIETYPNGNSARIKLVDMPSMSWVPLNEARTFYQTVNGADRYMGTYSSYNTVSLSETSYITGDNASAVDVSQYVLHFTKLADVPADPEEEQHSEDGVLTYNQYMNVADKGDVKVRGTLVYMATDKDLFLEDVDGNGYYLFNVDKGQFVLGDTLVVTGKKSIFNGLHEIKDWTAVKEGTAEVTARKDITNEVKANGLTVTAANQNQIVKISGTVTGAKELTVGEKKVSLYYKGDAALHLNDKVTFIGQVAINYSTSQIVLWKLADIHVDEEGEDEVLVPMTYAEYTAAADKASVVVKGTLVYVGDNKNAFLRDADGNGYYLYNKAITGFEVGDVMIVSGTKSIYNNLMEIKDWTATKDGKNEVPAVDNITSAVEANGLTVTDANQNQIVKLTGTLTGAKELTVGEKKVNLYLNNDAAEVMFVGDQLTIIGQLNVNGSKSNFAIWNKEAITVNQAAEAAITVTVSPAEAATHNLPSKSYNGTTLVFTVTPADTFELVEVLVNGTKIDAKEDGSFEMKVTKAMSVEINMKKAGQLVEARVYTLNGSIAGSGSGYAVENAITQNDVKWKVMGNTTMDPWRIGGKDVSGVDRVIYSEDALSQNMTKVELSVGSASSVTVNSVKLLVSKNKDFSNAKEVAGTFKTNSTITFERPTDDDWSNCYYKVVFNITITATSNKFVEFKKLEFFAMQ